MCGYFINISNYQLNVTYESIRRIISFNTLHLYTNIYKYIR